MRLNFFRMQSMVRVAVIAAIVGCAFSSQAGESRWELIDENEAVSDFYYDQGNVVRSPEGVVMVCAKAVYTPDGKRDALEVMGRGKGYENLSYSQFRYEIKCAVGSSRLDRVVHYDSKDKVIKEFNLAGKTEWEAIEPSTRIDLLREAVCKE